MVRRSARVVGAVSKVVSRSTRGSTRPAAGGRRPPWRSGRCWSDESSASNDAGSPSNSVMAVAGSFVDTIGLESNPGLSTVVRLWGERVELVAALGAKTDKRQRFRRR